MSKTSIMIYHDIFMRKYRDIYISMKIPGCYFLLVIYIYIGFIYT